MNPESNSEQATEETQHFEVQNRILVKERRSESVSAVMDVLSNDALLEVIAYGNFVAAHGIANLSATCKDVRRACRLYLASRYGCGNDVLMLWLVLAGQRISWIQDAMEPLWCASWLLWNSKDKRRNVITKCSPMDVNGVSTAYWIKDHLAAVATIIYRTERGSCTAAPDFDIEDLVRYTYKNYRKRPAGFVETFNFFIDAYCTQQLKADLPADYATCFEEGLPSRIPYRMEDDSHIRTLTRQNTRKKDGMLEFLPLRPYANPTSIHPAMRRGLQRVIVAYDGLVAVLEALSWETDVSSRIKTDNNRKHIASALRIARKVLRNLQATVK